jgi:V/A-type H+/Na+-transporting ATPase subunit I
VIVPMRKITFVGIESEKERFLESLQDVGLTHIILPKEALEPAELAKELQRIVETRKFLAKKGPKGEPEARLDCVEVCSKREELGREEAALHAEVLAVRKQRASIEPWGDFSVEDVENLRKRGLRIQFFRVSRRIFEALPLGDVFCQVASEKGGEICFATFSPEAVDLGVVEEKLPAKSLSEVDREIESKLARLREIEEEYKALAEHLEVLEKAEAERTDLLEHQRALMNAKPELENRIFVLQCWSPVPEAEVVSKLGATFAFYHYSEEPEEWDRMPVLLKNPPAFDSGEDLVKIYSYPSHNDFDPSPFVLYCFAVFFGMIVGDVGYGLVLLGMTFWITRKVKSRSPLAVRLFRLMYLLCVSVMFFGVVSASFFGIQLDPNNPWVQNAWLNYNTTEGQNHIMVVSILIGMTHISLSMLIKTYNARLYAGVGWVIAIWSAYFLINSKMGQGVDNPPATYGLIAGLAVVFLFSSKSRNPIVRIAEGFQGVLGAVQVFGDVLSYLRLFALGVATVYIALTFNRLGGAVIDSLPVIGVVFAGLILLMGHVLNIGLAIMGGVVHGLRLNFLEWYRWCFEGDGLPYKPFQRTSKP